MAEGTKKVFLDYDPTNDEIVYVEKFIEDIELPMNIDEEDLKEQQIKNIIQDEEDLEEEAYYDGKNIPEINEEIREILANIKTETDEIDREHEVERMLQLQQNKLESRYKENKKQFIKKEDSFKEVYSFEKEAKKAERRRDINKGDFISLIKSFFKSKKEKVVNIYNKDNKVENNVTKEQIPESQESQEANKEVESDENKEKLTEKIIEREHIKKDFKRFFIFVTFTLVVGIVVKYMFFNGDGLITNHNPNNNNTKTPSSSSPLVTNTPFDVRKPDDISIQTFLKYVDRARQTIDPIIILANEETNNISKYVNNQISRDELMRFVKQSKSKKEELDLYLNSETIPRELEELHNIVQRRIRESINISKSVLYHLSIFNKKSEISADVNKYITLDTDLAKRQRDMLISYYEKYNIKFNEETSTITVEN